MSSPAAGAGNFDFRLRGYSPVETRSSNYFPGLLTFSDFDNRPPVGGQCDINLFPGRVCSIVFGKHNVFIGVLVVDPEQCLGRVDCTTVWQ